jgi:hypothetical protein
MAVVLPFLAIFCTKDRDIEIDPHIYGTWKCYFEGGTSHGNDAKDTIPISLVNDSLKDSVCFFYAFYENGSFEYFEINGINNNKFIYKNGSFSTKDDYYCLSDACNYSLIVSNDTLRLIYNSDPNYELYLRKFAVCWK